MNPSLRLDWSHVHLYSNSSVGPISLLPSQASLPTLYLQNSNLTCWGDTNYHTTTDLIIGINVSFSGAASYWLVPVVNSDYLITNPHNSSWWTLITSEAYTTFIWDSRVIVADGGQTNSQSRH
jgi:hypothetical protein